MITNIKRPKGIEDLLGYTPAKVDEREIEVVGEHKFKGLLKKYEPFLEVDFLKKYGSWNDLVQKSNDIDEIMSNNDINSFLQLTTIHEDSNDYIWRTSLFISRLIHNSYNDGNNKFNLNLRNLKRLDYLCRDLISDENNPLSLDIDGDVGDWCGWNSENSVYTFHGDVGNWCGQYSTNCLYTFYGDVGKWCGWTANNCTFKTTKEETLQKLLKDVSKKYYNQKIGFTNKPSNNKIIFINPDKTEELVKHYDN